MTVEECENGPEGLHKFWMGTCLYCGAKKGDVYEDRVHDERRDDRDERDRK